LFVSEEIRFWVPTCQVLERDDWPLRDWHGPYLTDDEQAGSNPKVRRAANQD